MHTRTRPLLVHVTTTDMSLELLLGPQLEAFARLDDIMGLPAEPSAKAADIILGLIREARAARLPDWAIVLSTR